MVDDVIVSILICIQRPSAMLLIKTLTMNYVHLIIWNCDRIKVYVTLTFYMSTLTFEYLFPKISYKIYFLCKYIYFLKIL